MLFHVTLLSILTLVYSNLIGNKNSTQHGRVIGGQFAPINEYPHQVSLRFNGQHFCGGSIYKSNIIITAAHCLEDGTYLLTIGAGSAYWAEAQQVAEVKKCIIHEKYNRTTLDYDIALLVLEQPLQFNSNVRPIRLANRKPPSGLKVTVTGFGFTSENGASSDHLNHVELELISNSQCQQFYAQYPVTDRMLCAGVEAGGKDACKNDSGGPLISTAKGELLGVVSWGIGCARIGNPGVYASVPNLHKWIVHTARVNGGV